MVFTGINDPVCIETQACREAQAHAQDLNLGRIIISCDSKGVVNDIKHGSRGKNGTIVQEINANQQLFKACDIIFEDRTQTKKLIAWLNFRFLLTRVATCGWAIHMTLFVFL